MKAAKPKHDLPALVKELDLLFRETGDRRFELASDAIGFHFADTAQPKRRGPKLRWGDFEKMVLWVQVEARMRAFRLTTASACADLSKAPLGWLNGRSLSAGRLESYYYDAVDMLKADPASAREADSDAEAIARRLKSKRKASA